MSLTDLFAKNLAHAESGLSGGKAVRHAIGKGVIKGIGGMLQHGDQALGAGADALFSHGGPVAEGAGNILSSGFDALKSAPPAAKALAVGVPAYYYLRDRDANSLVEPMFNNYIEEGRTVTSSKKNKYADTDAFLAKQAGFLDFIMSPGMQHTVETAGKAIGEGGGAGKILEHLGGAAGHFRQAAQPALGAAQQAMHGSAGRGLLMGAGGLGLGAALAGAGSLLKPALSGMSGTGAYQLNRSMNSLPDRIQADELFAKTYVTGMASSAAQATASLLKDMAEKAMGAVTPQPDSSAMLEALTQSDPILRRGDQAVMLDAYHTMAKFAPTLATDENAVRSFLREAVVSGSGPDYASISNLAKAEDAVRKAQSPLKTASAGVDVKALAKLLARAGGHVAGGAALGAIGGAAGDTNDRMRGARRGAYTGGAIGLLPGAAEAVFGHHADASAKRLGDLTKRIEELQGEGHMGGFSAPNIVQANGPLATHQDVQNFGHADDALEKLQKRLKMYKAIASGNATNHNVIKSVSRSLTGTVAPMLSADVGSISTLADSKVDRLKQKLKKGF